MIYKSTKAYLKVKRFVSSFTDLVICVNNFTDVKKKDP